MLLKIIIKKDNKLLGSFDLESITQMISSNKLTKDDLYSLDNGKSWTKLSHLLNESKKTNKFKLYTIFFIASLILYSIFNNSNKNYKLIKNIKNSFNVSKEYLNHKILIKNNTNKNNLTSNEDNNQSSIIKSNLNLPKGKRMYNEELMNEVSQPANLDEDN